jgi:hypothetical protein
MMKHSVKGALLSAVVFPGLGQVVLKHYKRGVALMVTVSVGLVVIVVRATQEALAILSKIEAEGGAIDMAEISNAVNRATSFPQSLVFNSFLLLIAFCWVYGIVDAYRIGNKKDEEERSTGGG